MMTSSKLDISLDFSRASIAAASVVHGAADSPAAPARYALPSHTVGGWRVCLRPAARLRLCEGRSERHECDGSREEAGISHESSPDDEPEAALVLLNAHGPLGLSDRADEAPGGCAVLELVRVRLPNKVVHLHHYAADEPRPALHRHHVLDREAPAVREDVVPRHNHAVELEQRHRRLLARWVCGFCAQRHSWRGRNSYSGRLKPPVALGTHHGITPHIRSFQTPDCG